MNDVGVAVVFSDEAERRIGIFIHGRIEAFVYPGHQPRQVGADAGKQIRMSLCAGAVPVLPPDVLRFFVDINLAFHHHEIIRTHAEMRARQRLQQTGQIAPGIDHPLGAGCLELADQALQFVGHGRILKLGKKCSIEIGGNDFDRQIHSV